MVKRIISCSIPTGLVSKNNIGACKIALNILLCKLRAAARQIRKLSIVLDKTSVTELDIIPPYMPILWLVDKSYELLRDKFPISVAHDSPPVALGTQ